MRKGGVWGKGGNPKGRDGSGQWGIRGRGLVVVELESWHRELGMRGTQRSVIAAELTKENADVATHTAQGNRELNTSPYLLQQLRHLLGKILDAMVPTTVPEIRHEPQSIRQRHVHVSQYVIPDGSLQDQ